jgi:hypothetical protein
MTANTFNELCQRACVTPELALENDDIVQALKNNDDGLVLTLLCTQF